MSALERITTVRRLLALVVGLALSLSACASPAASPSAASPTTAAPAKVTMGLTYIPNIQFAPYYVAAGQGLFADAGADVTLRHHGANEGLFTALAAGQEDVVVAGGDELLQARAEGMDLVAIAQYYRTYPVVVIVPQASAITKLSDLKGRTIGVPGRYGETWFGLQVALKSAGLAESDGKINEIGYTQQAALTTGKVDAIVGFSNNDQVQFRQAGFATRTIPLAPEGQNPLVSISLITTRSWLDAHPDAARAVARATVAGVQRTVADPDAALTTSRTYIPQLANDTAAQARAKATLEATLPLWKGTSTIDGRLDEARWAAMASFMAEQGLTSKPVDAAQAISTQPLA